MLRPTRPDNESERLAALHRYQVLDTAPDSAYDDLVTIAAAICAMPMGSITLIDADRQWLKSKLGLEGTKTTRDEAFCAHTILAPSDLLVVNDALEDERFRDHPCVLGDPHIRFYAGAPLVTPEGFAVGALCVMDREPRTLQPYQLGALRALSRQVAALLELRRIGHALNLQLSERDWYEEQLHRFSEQLEARNADLTEQARLDTLTGLANRRAFGAALEHALAAEGDFFVAILDVDHFKRINDTHGHPAGDQVLIDVANALRSASGGHGLVARHGGEEFAWLCPHGDETQARLQCDYLREAVSHASQALPVTISIGITARRADDSVASLMQRADAALYSAKHSGRNCVVSA